MGFELEKRIASELAGLVTDDAKRPADDVELSRIGKLTRVEQFKRLAAELERRLLGDRAADEQQPIPGKLTQPEQVAEAAVATMSSAVDQARAALSAITRAAPRASRLDEFRTQALSDVLHALGRVTSKRRLQQETLAAADPRIASQASRTKLDSRPGDAAGHALWRAAERRSATLYRHAQDAGEVEHEDPIVEQALARAGSGQALPTATRKKMERELGISLDRVRIHTDSVAAGAARAVRAQAFTVGEDIFFAEQAYAPESRAGQKLLAHELAHVVQAWEGRTSRGGRGITVSQPGEALEQEAEAVADRVGAPPRVARGSTPRIPARGPARLEPRPAPAAPSGPSRRLMRRPDAAAPNAANHAAANKEPAHTGEVGPNGEQATMPSVRVNRDHGKESAHRKAHKSTLDFKGSRDTLTKQVQGATKGSLGQLKASAAAAKNKPVGRRSHDHQQAEDKHHQAHQHKANAAARQHHAEAAAAASAQPAHAAPHHPHHATDVTGAHGIQFKPISDWNKYLPQALPDQDERERKRLLKLVQKQVNSDRAASAQSLAKLKNAQAHQAAAVRAMAPVLQGQIAGAQRAALGQVSSAEAAQCGSVQAHVAGVQAEVRDHASAMTAQIAGAAANTLRQIKQTARDALQQLQQAQTKALADIDVAEANAIVAVGALYTAAKANIISLGTTKASEALGVADTVTLDYSGKKLKAAQKAAHETASQYAEAMPDEASKAAAQVGENQPKSVADIRKMATDQRKAVQDTYKQAKQVIDQSEQQASTAANQIKTSATGQVQNAATSSNAQLTAHGAAQVAAIRQQAAGARSGITQAGQAAQGAVGEQVSKAAAGILKGTAGISHGAKKIEAPNPEDMANSVTDGIRQLGHGTQQIGAGLNKTARTSSTGLTTQATHAASGMTESAAAANAAATQMGAGAKQSMTGIAQGASTSLQSLSKGFGDTCKEVTQSGDTGMKGLTDGLAKAYAAGGKSLGDGLTSTVAGIKTNFDQAVPGQEKKDIAAAAKKAADAVKPWWQKALAVIASVVVAIVVVVVITALIVTTGPVGAILVGAAAGALGSVAGTMASNLVLGNGLTEGITWQSVAMGAIGGGVAAGLSAGLSAGAGALATGGGRLAGAATRVGTALEGGAGLGNYGIRLGVNVANDAISDAASQLIVTGKYEFSVENLVTSIATNSITSTHSYETMQQRAQARLTTAVGGPLLTIGTPKAHSGGVDVSGGPGSTPSTPSVNVDGRGVHVHGDPIGAGAHPEGAAPGGAHAPSEPHPAGDAHGAPAGGATAHPAGDSARPAGDHGAGGAGAATPAEGAQPAAGASHGSGGATPEGGRAGDAGSGAAGGPANARGANDPAAGGAHAGGANEPGGAHAANENAPGGAAADGAHAGDNAHQADGVHADPAQGAQPAEGGANAARPAEGGASAAHPAEAGAGGAHPGEHAAGDPAGAHGEPANANAHGEPASGSAPGGEHAASDPAGAHAEPSQGAAAPGGEHAAEHANPQEEAAAAAHDSEMNDLGYPAGTREQGAKVADAIEGGGKPNSETLRDTEANQRGAHELDAVNADPKLTAEQQAKLHKDVAEHLRANEEPTGNLERDVAAAKQREGVGEQAAKGKDGATPDPATGEHAKPAENGKPGEHAKPGENEAAQAKGTDPAATKEPQVDTGGKGLADPQIHDAIAAGMHEVQGKWATLTPEARMQALGEKLNSQLRAAGLPEVEIKMADIGGRNGQFEFGTWSVTLSEATVHNGHIDAETMAGVVNTTVHEARHAEQWYMIARHMLGEGKPVATVAHETQIPEHIVQRAAAETKPMTPEQAAAAKSYYDSVYGANSAHREAVLTRLGTTGEESTRRNAEYDRINNDPNATAAEKQAAFDAAMKAWEDSQQAHKDYKNLPEEADAWAVGDAAGDSFAGQAKAAAGPEGPTPKPKGRLRQLWDRIFGSKGPREEAPPVAGGSAPSHDGTQKPLAPHETTPAEGGARGTPEGTAKSTPEPTSEHHDPTAVTQDKAHATPPPEVTPAQRRASLDDPHKTTAEAYAAVDLPKSPKEQKRVLLDESAWTPERQSLHKQILDRSIGDARAFADAHAEAQASGGQDHTPEVFAMRGNTAAGKTRAVKQGLVPELQKPVKATEDLRHRAVNPDNFKIELYAGEGAGLTAGQVHTESSVLAELHSRALETITTSDGKTGSVLIDKRLGTTGDVGGLQVMAEKSGRHFTLIDVDAPLSNSLGGVLGDRVPGGNDPIPPFNAIAEGYHEARAQREAVIKQVAADPNAQYKLFSTKPDGSKMLVAEIHPIEKGGAMPENPMERLVVHDRKQYQKLLQTAEQAHADIEALRTQPLTKESIRALTEPMGDYGKGLAKRLEQHMGKTWEQAINEWSTARPESKASAPANQGETPKPKPPEEHAARKTELGTDPKRGYLEHEGAVGAEIENRFGGFERDPTGNGEWVGKTAPYKGKVFDLLGIPEGKERFHGPALEKFLPSVDAHFLKAVDYVVLDTRHMTVEQKKTVMDHIDKKWSSHKSRLIVL